MMKGFLKSGKFLGLLLLACGLVFAGCAGDPNSSALTPGGSSEGNVPTDSQTSVAAIPVTFEDGQVTFGDGSAMASTTIDGHTVTITNAAPCAGTVDGATCKIKLINNDSDEIMTKVTVTTASCSGCAGAKFDNSDVGAGAIDGGGFCYVDSGNISVCDVHAVPSGNRPDRLIHPDCGSHKTMWDFGGQTSVYTFYASLTAEWHPWLPVGADLAPGGGDDDPRFNFADRTTFYVMLSDTRDRLVALEGTIAANAKKFNIGSYRRSYVIAGHKWVDNVNYTAPDGSNPARPSWPPAVISASA